MINFFSFLRNIRWADLDDEELGGITFDYFIKSLDVNKGKKEKKDTIRRIYRKYDKKE